VFSDLLTMTKELEVCYREETGCLHRSTRKREHFILVLGYEEGTYKWIREQNGSRDCKVKHSQCSQEFFFHDDYHLLGDDTVWLL
jgi:hypothetical protein